MYAALYSSVAYQTYTTLLAYYQKTTITTVEEIMQKSGQETGLLFPPISICHTGNFNKTFVRQSIRITSETLKKAKIIGLDEDKLLEEFLRYMNLFSMFVDVGRFKPEVWDVLTEIYDATFRGDVHFSDLVADAAFRGKALFKNCQWAGRKYPCSESPIITIMPSCYYLMVGWLLFNIYILTVRRNF